VGLSGGVFQNQLLMELVVRLLRQHGFRCYMPERVPVNDGGLGYGQIVEYYGSIQTAINNQQEQEGVLL
jgi:hydrogenase maturation protein HypF